MACDSDKVFQLNRFPVSTRVCMCVCVRENGRPSGSGKFGVELHSAHGF